MRKAVVVLSGGLDSTTVLAIAKSQGFEIHAMTFNYGQRHSCELEAAKRAVKAVGGVKEHRFFVLDLDSQLGGSVLLQEDGVVPKGKEAEEYRIQGKVPPTYVPGRNLIFISIAAAWAEILGARDLFLGINAVDYSGYPDCRPGFLSSVEQALDFGTKCGVEGDPIGIQAPLLHMTKAEIIRKGLSLGIDYSLTHSCYDPINDRACGACDSCLLRKKGFEEAGVPDPTLYYNEVVESIKHVLRNAEYP